VACTHTHSGPDTVGWYEFAQPLPSSWFQRMYRLATDAVDSLVRAARGLRENLTAGDWRTQSLPAKT
jgi:hypothetical protein